MGKSIPFGFGEMKNVVIRKWNKITESQQKLLNAEDGDTFPNIFYNLKHSAQESEQIELYKRTHIPFKGMKTILENRKQHLKYVS